MDDNLCVSTQDGRKTATFYDLDGTQPYGLGIYLDPDNTMIQIDVGRGQKSTTKVSDFKPEYLLYGAIAVVILFSVVSGAFA